MKYIYNGGPENIQGKIGGYAFPLPAGKVTRIPTLIRFPGRGEHQVVMEESEIVSHLVGNWGARGLVVLSDGMDMSKIPDSVRIEALRKLVEHLNGVVTNFEHWNEDMQASEHGRQRLSQHMKDRLALRDRVLEQLKGMGVKDLGALGEPEPAAVAAAEDLPDFEEGEHLIEAGGQPIGGVELEPEGGEDEASEEEVEDEGQDPAETGVGEKIGPKRGRRGKRSAEE